ncbi:MAG: phosphotransferase family protein [Candidatus Heimdallarchaeota archaeon]
MPLNKPLAVGRTAEVFPWEENQILKLFLEGMSSDWVEYELNVSKLVETVGLQVPKVFKRVEVNGRHGIVYEHIKGSSMLRTMQSNLWKLKSYARQLAELHISIHDVRISELPSLKEKLESKILSQGRLTLGEKQEIVRILQDLPDDNRLCHGDFHPDNIILTTNGPFIIDWLDATRGNPLADIARTNLLLKIAVPPTGWMVRFLIRVFQSRFQKYYQRHYFQISDQNQEQLKHWQLPVAAARLVDNIPEERPQLLDLIRSQLTSS